MLRGGEEKVSNIKLPHNVSNIIAKYKPVASGAKVINLHGLTYLSFEDGYLFKYLQYNIIIKDFHGNIAGMG